MDLQFAAELIIVLILLLYGIYMFTRNKNPMDLPPGTIPVPQVQGGLPLIGHGLEFSRDTLGFISRCCSQYGKVFKVKIFRYDIIVVCDRLLSNDFFKVSEETLSLYDTLRRLYFDDAFSDKPNFLPIFIDIIRKSIAVKFDLFVPKILGEAERMVEKLKDKCHGGQANKNINLAEEMLRFVANTSAKCFISFELDDNIFASLQTFTNLLNHILIATWFLPKWFIRFLLNPIISKLRKNITKSLEPEIQKYRDDPEKSDSLIFRLAVDSINPETGRQLTNEEIGGIIVCLLYISSENTSLGLTNTLTDLALHPDYWGRLKTEVQTFIETKDYKGLLNSPLLNACIMESARQTPHIFSLNRTPKNKSSATIGNYFVGNTDCIAMCGPMLMFHDFASEIFLNPNQYNPDRFLGQKHESWNQYSIMTWGAGVHLCPGKMFALYEIKMATALILLNFNFETDKTQLSKLNYFSPSAFAERKVQTSLKIATKFA